MSKLELFSIKDISSTLGLKQKTIYNRVNILKLKPYKKQKQSMNYYDRNQLIRIMNFTLLEKETPDIIYTIHKHTQEFIFESKINKKRAVYGTHRRNQYKKI
jgi:hypothetical protein